jgi:site-specific DNA-methyltransferase (adenine-specific)
MVWKLFEGDCLEIMSSLNDKSIDMILCDLPYGVTACKWDTIIPLEPLWEQYKRIIKDKGAIVLTASQPFTTTLISSNMDWFRYEWVWEKSIGGGFLNANRQPLKRHENILVFSKKQTTYNPQMMKGKPYSCRSSSAGETTHDQTVSGWITKNNGLRYPVSYLKFSSNTGLHPTQKPVALFEYLIKTYTNENDLILDNCAGSGTTGVACHNLNRDCIMIEKEQEYCKIIKDRMKEVTIQEKLL